MMSVPTLKSHFDRWDQSKDAGDFHGYFGFEVVQNLST